MADHEAEVRDHALDAIDEALDKFRADMRRTEKKFVGGEWVEEPVMLIMPKDIPLLIDRLVVLIDHPAHSIDQDDLGVKSEIPLEALSRFVELTRGRVVPPTSPLPRTPSRLDD